MTKPIPDLTEFPQEVQEAFEAGQISLNDIDFIRRIIDQYGIERGINALKYLEKLKSIETYYQSIPHGFKIKEFTFNWISTGLEEKQKMAVALKEALDTLLIYLRLEGY